MKIGPDTPAIVTGGASGLGRACAALFRDCGAPVTILDTDEARGYPAAEGIGARFALCDVTSEESVTEALATAAEVNGPARIAVSCAGIAPAAKVAGSKGAHPMDLFRTVIDVNLVGTMRVMAHAAQAMRGLEPLDADGCRGVVVNTASVAAFEGQMGQAAYAASKGGVAALTLPAARDLHRDGIRVCAIAPGTFRTPMLEGLPEEVQESLAAQVPFPQRLGDPAEFARLAAFIVETGYMNGEVIRLDGAMRMGVR
jgi:NAD(P)-dependent dehydrogenase (short-subunit alcohol dehydrogenase family)